MRQVGYIILTMKAFVNATLITGDGRTIEDACLLSEDGFIVCLGPAGEENIPGDAEKIDLNGGYVYPGFHDAHGHLLSLGNTLESLRLEGAASPEELVEKTAEYAKKNPRREWILGRGWDHNDWGIDGFPDNRGISAAVPDRPAYLTRVDGHMAIANERALAIAGVDEATPDPSGGRIMRDASGRATGILLDNAMELVKKVIPEPSREEKEEMILAACRHAASMGLVSVHDMCATPEEVKIYIDLAERGLLPVLVYGAVNDEPLYAPVRMGNYACRMVKALYDGALGSQGAALDADYADAPGERGVTMWNVDDLSALAGKCLERDFQLAVHAIGDRAARETLDAFENALAANPRDDHRFRLEHVQIISAADIERIGRLGVAPSVQPIHFARDQKWAHRFIGPERIETSYAWKSLLASAGVIPLGSDFPVETADPMPGFAAAISRPGDPWPDEGLTREQALAGYTRDAAYASFSDGVTGTLEPGKRTDLTVLSENLLDCDVSDIYKARVIATVVGGETAYLADS